MNQHEITVSSTDMDRLQLGPQIGKKRLHLTKDDAFNVGEMLHFREAAPDPKKPFVPRVFMCGIGDLIRGPVDGLADGYVVIELRS